MDLVTPETREVLIIRAIEKIPNIGFNQLQKETGLARKTLRSYLNSLIENEAITEEKTGKNRGLKYNVKFSDHTKKAIRHNLSQITQHDLSFFDTKYRKSNTFPHLLQALAAEYYQNLISYFFDSVPAYRYGVKRIEEFLEKEKEKFDKEFTGKNKVRLHDACQEVQFVLSSNAWNAEIDSQERNMHRTRDEVIVDCNVPAIIYRGILRQKQEFDKEFSRAKWGLDDNRVDLIEDKKTKALFIELANEYNELSQKLRNIKTRLAWMVHGPPWEPKGKDFNDFDDMFSWDE